MSNNTVVEIERMSYGPDAIGHLPSGKTVFVEGAAPGDVARIEVFEEKDSFAKAKLVSLEQPSPARTAPLSPADAACGTAPWQHIAYDEQLKAKRANVTSSLMRIGHFDEARTEELVASCLGCKHPWNYRNKIELGAAIVNGAFEVGFFREGTDELLPADSTKLAHKKIERTPKAVRGAMRFVQGGRDLGIFRIGVRHSHATGELEIALWTCPGNFPRALVAKTLTSACKATSVVRVLANPGKARKVKGVEILEGRGYWAEEVHGARFSVQAPSFFQVNTAQAERLVRLVVDHLGERAGSLEGVRVADLYAGAGLFSIALAQEGADVVAIEAASSSVRDLRFNAEANEVYVDVIGGDAAHEFAEVGSVDALVVDPPRAGLAESVVADIAAARPETIAYVSCDPATWARDMARFEQQGYRLESAMPVDMFPQTYHVEIVSFLNAI